MRIPTSELTDFYVFDEGRYAIFETYKVFILCGRNVLRPRGEPEKITKEDILRRYCIAILD